MARTKNFRLTAENLLRAAVALATPVQAAKLQKLIEVDGFKVISVRNLEFCDPVIVVQKQGTNMPFLGVVYPDAEFKRFAAGQKATFTLPKTRTPRPAAGEAVRG